MVVARAEDHTSRWARDLKLASKASRYLEDLEWHSESDSKLEQVATPPADHVGICCERAGKGGILRESHTAEGDRVRSRCIGGVSTRDWIYPRCRRGPRGDESLLRAVGKGANLGQCLELPLLFVPLRVDHGAMRVWR